MKQLANARRSQMLKTAPRAARPSPALLPGRRAITQPRRPSHMSTAAPSSLAASKAMGEAAISAVIPAADRVRNSTAWVRIAATAHRPRRRPCAMPVWMQLRWFGPGVTTNTTQNSAKMVHASKLMRVLSINRRRDHPDRNAGGVMRIGPAIGLATKAETVAGTHAEVACADAQLQPTREDVAHFLRRALGRGLHARAGSEGGVDHLEIIGEIRGKQFLDQPFLARSHGAAGAGAHHIALFIGGCAGMAEKQGHRHTKLPGDLAQIRDRRLGKIALHLAEPADRAAKTVGKIGQRQAARLAQGAQIGPEGLGAADICLLHEVRRLVDQGVKKSL